jgi:hypothetical protein
MKYLLVIITLPLLAGAANIFVWNYQATDTIYDAESGTTVDHTYWVQQLLTNLGHTLTVDTVLPSSLAGYDAAFALCGWYNC